ncbi:MAG: hypothetical protein ACQ9MH_23770, partial [Nitrospinales bacterium]
PQRNRLRIPQGRDAEKQNDSILRVIKCPYRHLATKELMPFVVSAAQAAECFSIARSQRQLKNYYSLRPLCLKRSGR